MKKRMKPGFLRSFLIIGALFASLAASSQLKKKDRRLVEDANDARKEFIQTDSSMKTLFHGAYGFVIFPTIGKGAFGIGGAGGPGVLYHKDSALGKAEMTQLTIGFQVGGQSYREVIFFQDKETFENFKQNNIELSMQTSAVAAKSGASATAQYSSGVMIFTQLKGGLMYEASVGGQKFNYKPFNQE